MQARSDSSLEGLSNTDKYLGETLMTIYIGKCDYRSLKSNGQGLEAYALVQQFFIHKKKDRVH